MPKLKNVDTIRQLLEEGKLLKISILTTFGTDEYIYYESFSTLAWNGLILSTPDQA